MNDLPPSLSKTPNIPPKEQTGEQLIAEREYWTKRLTSASGPASAYAAQAFLRSCESELQSRQASEGFYMSDRNYVEGYVAALDDLIKVFDEDRPSRRPLIEKYPFFAFMGRARDAGREEAHEALVRALKDLRRKAPRIFKRSSAA